MRQTSDEFKINPGGAIMKYLGLLMAVVYIAVGGLIIFVGPTTQFNIPDQYILPLGLALLAYGLIRGYRVYTKHFTK